MNPPPHPSQNDEQVRAWMESHGFRWSQGGYWVSDTLGLIAQDQAAFFYNAFQAQQAAAPDDGELRTKIAIALAGIEVNSKDELYAVEDAGDKILALFTQYAEKREAKWYSVKESLPLEGEIVVARCEWVRSRKPVYTVLKKVDEGDCDWRTADDNSELDYSVNVTHWQPLARLKEKQ